MKGAVQRAVRTLDGRDVRRCPREDARLISVHIHIARHMTTSLIEAQAVAICNQNGVDARDELGNRLELFGHPRIRISRFEHVVNPPKLGDIGCRIGDLTIQRLPLSGDIHRKGKSQTAEKNHRDQYCHGQIEPVFHASSATLFPHSVPPSHCFGCSFLRIQLASPEAGRKAYRVLVCHKTPRTVKYNFNIFSLIRYFPTASAPVSVFCSYGSFLTHLALIGKYLLPFSSPAHSAQFPRRPRTLFPP